MSVQIVGADDALGAEYDAIGDKYSEAKTAPWRIHLEAYTLERVLGDVRGLRILDLACGDGFYARRQMRRGASAVVGVDVSAEMVALGEHEEVEEPLGCSYLCHDVLGMGSVGYFDAVIAAYLLNYARTRSELAAFCGAAFENLAPGGRLIGVNDWNGAGAHGPQLFERHGFRKIVPDAPVEGDPIRYEFMLPDGRDFTITNYYWRPETYARALEDAGFADVEWHALQISSAGTGSFPPGFWDDLRATPPIAAYSARRR